MFRVHQGEGSGEARVRVRVGVRARIRDREYIGFVPSPKNVNICRRCDVQT